MFIERSTEYGVPRTPYLLPIACKLAALHNVLVLKEREGREAERLGGVTSWMEYCGVRTVLTCRRRDEIG